MSSSSQYAGWLTTIPRTSAQTYAKPDLGTGKKEAGEILRERARLGFGAGWKTISVSDLYNDIEINGKADDYFIINYFASTQYDALTGQTSAQVTAYLNALGYDAYSLKFGVNAICYDNDAVCTTKYHAASTNHPVVSGS